MLNASERKAILFICLLIGAGGLLRLMPVRFSEPVIAGQHVPLRINVNTASTDELIRLNGIGIKTAEAIIRYRTQNGPFQEAEDLLKVKGIGTKKLDAIRTQIHF